MRNEDRAARDVRAVGENTSGVVPDALMAIDNHFDDIDAALKDVQAAERLVLAAEGLAASPAKRPYAARNLDAALGPAPAPFSLEDGPVGFDLPDFAIEA